MTRHLLGSVEQPHTPRAHACVARQPSQTTLRGCKPCMHHTVVGDTRSGNINLNAPLRLKAAARWQALHSGVEKRPTTQEGCPKSVCSVEIHRTQARNMHPNAMPNAMLKGRRSCEEVQRLPRHVAHMFSSISFVNWGRSKKCWLGSGCWSKIANEYGNGEWAARRMAHGVKGGCRCFVAAAHGRDAATAAVPDDGG